MRKYILIILTLVAVGVWLAVFTVNRNLHIIACDIGQGDAILIQHKNDQILVDGGPDSKVLDCLGRHMPFWDRKIELVILTHTDADHITGLLDVFNNYEVETFLTNDLSEPKFSSRNVEVLRSKVGSGGVNLLPVIDDLQLRLGLMCLDILSPTDEMKNLKAEKTNNMSIVFLLKYADFEALFTGDIETRVSDQVSTLIKTKGLDYIKIPHHGSKNGISQKLLDVTKPKIAVISVGKNSYGHPHKEVLEMLKNINTKILRTDEMGDVVVENNGEDVFIK